MSEIRFDEVVAAWDAAARTDEAALHVHPMGADREAWLASGRTTAAEIRAVWDRHVEAGEPTLVMDFGCGLGRVTRFLPGEFLRATVYGVDSSPSMIEGASADVPAGAVRWSVGAGPDLPEVYAGLVDLICCSAVFIHHSHADGERLLGWLAQCLAPGGLLVADIPCYEVGRERGSWCDVSTYTTAQLCAAAGRSGLEPIDIASSVGEFSFESVGTAHGHLQTFRRTV